MQNTWRTQVKRITIAIAVAVAVAGGVQIAEEGSHDAPVSITADGTPGAPVPVPTTTSESGEWH
ncbi:hypothetical protein ACFXJO_19945 [Streptomyces lavendulae]|uniref:hypothetical protein n=1 Tax=Streptomyces TaxID=1883 RepID=UPI0024755CA2|nr:hypothetical protein [Streptomyces sp. SPB4]MDH6538282.1 negative regulator of sigma E activity [Streptomyces sp. SPB4]